MHSMTSPQECQPPQETPDEVSLILAEVERMLHAGATAQAIQMQIDKRMTEWNLRTMRQLRNPVQMRGNVHAH